MYTPTTWVNGSTPALNATNLNHIEQGIADASFELCYGTISSNSCTITNENIHTTSLIDYYLPVISEYASASIVSEGSVTFTFPSDTTSTSMYIKVFNPSVG